MNGTREATKSKTTPDCPNLCSTLILAPCVPQACTNSYADLASFYIERGDTEPPPALDPELGQRDKFGLQITTNELARMVVRAERLRAQVRERNLCLQARETWADRIVANLTRYES